MAISNRAVDKTVRQKTDNAGRGIPKMDITVMGI
jgi:hypothetical protein